MTTKQYILLILMSFSVFALGYALGFNELESACLKALDAVQKP